MRKYLFISIALLLAVGLMQSLSFADERAGYRHGGHHSGHHGKHSIEDRFFNRAKLIYRNQDALNVNEKQINQIRDLKTDLKKDLIRKRAELDLIKIDIRALFYEDDIDVRAANDLLDKKYEIKKAKMKKLVSSYAQLKKILSKEQNEKLMDIYYGQRKMTGAKGSYKRGMHR